VLGLRGVALRGIALLLRGVALLMLGGIALLVLLELLVLLGRSVDAKVKGSQTDLRPRRPHPR
jgi:hypothetical protein